MMTPLPARCPCGAKLCKSDEIEQATPVAIVQLNWRANTWLWERPRHQIIAIIAASFLIAFQERSSRKKLRLSSTHSRVKRYPTPVAYAADRLLA